MALEQLGLIEFFSWIFPFLLVFAIVYALFEKFKLLGDSKSIHAIIAIAIAFIVLISRDVTAIINYIAPWFVLMIIFIILLLVVYKIFGASDKDLADFITTHTMTQWVIILIGILIVISGISAVYGQRLVPYTQEGETVDGETVDGEDVTLVTEGDSFGSSVAKTLFSPKILGLFLIFMIAAFSIGLLTQPSAK